MSYLEVIENASEGDNPRAHWPVELQNEFDTNYYSGVVGSVLVSETELLRVWHLNLKPGKRCDFHRHVLNYFWTCHTYGKARGYYDDGRIQEVNHFPGDTMHFTFAKGEGFNHSIMNVGDTELIYTTVEFKNSSNEPLDIPDNVRLKSKV
tara:strand:+ start:1008 stop:1457 length:450 start_codon:yes stop_codon:yes gene_type:complete